MFVTFYSYKGGVGRTVALVNVAFQLAQEGKQVVLLDFDLEAPGLHKYPFCKRKVKKGILDYICDFVENESIPDIKEYLLFPEKGKYENITLFPAGTCDENYMKNLAQLNWNIIYSESYGFDFIENMKSDIVKACDTPDYVFIDSRTGLSDTGNICTLQIPDIVVLLFSLNNQNREGIEKVYGEIKGFKNPLTPEKKIDVITVATPVPYGEAGLKSRCLSEFSKIFTSKEKILVLPYHPRLAFKETLILENEMKEEDIANRISDLAKEIKRQNPMDTEKYKDAISLLSQKGEWEKAISIQRKVAEIKENDPKEWGFLAFLYFITRRFEDALREIDKAIALDLNNLDFLFNKASTLINLNRLADALPLYDKAIEINPNNPDFLYNKANTLFNLQRFADALPLYDKAIEIDPHNPDFLYNKAGALSKLERFEDALQLYDKAIKINPHNADFLNNKGFALFNLKRFEESIPLYDKAIEINPQIPDFYLNKATALLELKRFEEALPLFDKAIELNPNNPHFFNNKGFALFNLKRFDEALTLLDKANDIAPNHAKSYYYKACALSLMGKKKESLEYLKKAIELDPGSKESAKTDPDLKSLYNLSSFKKLVGLDRKAGKK